MRRISPPSSSASPWQAAFAFFGVSWLYETWKEKAQEKGGTGAKVARVSDTIGRGIGAGLSGLQWIFVKGFGVVSVLVAVLLLYLLSVTGFDLFRIRRIFL